MHGCILDGGLPGRLYGDPAIAPLSSCERVTWRWLTQSDIHWLAQDHHHYPEPQVPYDLGDIARVQQKPFLQGEYGGFSSAIAQHQWNRTGCSRFTSSNARLWAAAAPESSDLNSISEVTSTGDTGMQVRIGFS